MILAACGLQRETRSIARAGIVAVAGGGDVVRLEHELEAALTATSSRRTAGPRVTNPAPASLDPDARQDDAEVIILSIGIAGALSSALTVGDLVIGADAFPHSSPRTSSGVRRAADATQAGKGARWTPEQVRGDEFVMAGAHNGNRALIEHLHKTLPTARIGTVVGQDAPAATLEEKRHLRATTGALAVDMESHIAARVAARHGLPFAAIRVISDDAGRTLPPAALVGMRPDGGMALGAVLASIAKNPRQLPALIRTGIDAERAFRALSRALRALEAHGISQLDLGEFGLDG